jgi:hypothetical protein
VAFVRSVRLPSLPDASAARAPFAHNENALRLRVTVIEEANILFDHPASRALAEKQDVIQAFAPNTAEKA